MQHRIEVGIEAGLLEPAAAVTAAPTSLAWVALSSVDYLGTLSLLFLLIDLGGVFVLAPVLA